MRASASSLAALSGTVVGLTLRLAKASARCALRLLEGRALRLLEGRALRLLVGRAEVVEYSRCAAGKGPSPCAGAVAGGGTSAAIGF
jgi:hypothetical protein